MKMQGTNRSGERGKELAMRPRSCVMTSIEGEKKSEDNTWMASNKINKRALDKMGYIPPKQ